MLVLFASHENPAFASSWSLQVCLTVFSLSLISIESSDCMSWELWFICTLLLLLLEMRQKCALFYWGDLKISRSLNVFMEIVAVFDLLHQEQQQQQDEWHTYICCYWELSQSSCRQNPKLKTFSGFRNCCCFCSYSDQIVCSTDLHPHPL